MREINFEGEPFQVIIPEMTLPLHVVDLQGMANVVMAVKEEEHERLGRLVSELEALSDEEAKRLLTREEPQRDPNSFLASKPVRS